MRFVTFSHRDTVRTGILLNDQDSQDGLQVLDGAELQQRLPLLRSVEPDMRAWLEIGLASIAKAVRGSKIPRDALLPLNQVRLCSPLLAGTGKIVGAAFNYRDGLALGTRPTPKDPVIFIKSSKTIVMPGEPIQVVPEADYTYEAELAVIIGRQALNVPREKTMEHIAGYTMFNDVSATRYVREDGAFVRGKNQPASGPLGPWIVLSEDVNDPHDLPISLSVDGKRMQHSNTAQMLHRIDALIEYISAQMPLDVGDIVATGTPAGVAVNHKPAAWLREGQHVVIKMTPWFGELANPVVSITQGALI